MNVILAVREYVTKMISDSQKSGMKVLLLDKQTTGIISLVYTQSEILQKEVFLVEQLSSQTRDRMSHLKAICFIRPSPESIRDLVTELKAPKYGQYFIYMSNTMKKSDLERLAEADEHEVVREVQEYFADYYCVNSTLFTLNMPGVLGDHKEWRAAELERSVEGLIAVSLSLRKRPIIRFQKSSPMCKKLAGDVLYAMQQEAHLFDFRTSDIPPLLLIVDRTEDPVTPLLNQWTYQAMVHELLGIKDNRVSMDKVASADMREVVLSAEQDSFFKTNMNANFGEIGEAIKDLVERFQAKSKTNRNLESIQDIKTFIESYPDFRAMSGTVSKHVTVMGELNRIVVENQLFNISELEQNIACQAADHSPTLQRVREIISDVRVKDIDKVRVATLYALRYEKSNNDISGVLDHLSRVGVDAQYIKAINTILTLAGHNARTSDLFGNKGVQSFFKKKMQSLKGIENVYTQHEPLLMDTIDQLLKMKLKDSVFPFVGPQFQGRPNEIIVFIVGGATYEEARACSRLETTNGVRIVLGSNQICNIHGFLEEFGFRGGRAERVERP